MGNTDMNEFKKTTKRQRLSPRLFDYSFLLLKSNREIFSKFCGLIQGNQNRILDVGCGFKPWQDFFKKSGEYVGVDYDKEKSSADLTALADDLPFEENSFDALIYSVVLEHVYDLDKVFSEMKRVAKNGSLVFISAPFVFPEHGAPYDFNRPTEYFYREIFKNDEIIFLVASNSSLSTAITAINLAIEATPFRKLFIIKEVIYIITNFMGLITDIAINFILKIAGYSEKYHKDFFNMPLGYSLIVKIKK